MARKIPEQELAQIVGVVSRFPEGVSIEEVNTDPAVNLPRRTLQRRLALLVEQGRVVKKGKGRASRYILPSNTGRGNMVLPAFQSEAYGEIYVPVSPAGQSIKQSVRSPIHERQPAGYNREFLDAYRPNKTFYLEQGHRDALNAMGRARMEDLPAGTYARTIYNRLLIDLSWNSSRLEGNTYSLLETELLLEQSKVAEDKSALETQMILNHKAAIDLLISEAEDVGFNRYTVLNLHALLADNLLADPEACGRLRSVPISIEGSTYHPLEIPQLIEECFQQILDTARAIRDPFEQSFFVMVHLPYLQPFEDVNKRVSRLSANIPFFKHNLSPLSFTDVPERAYIDAMLGVYELNRIELLRDVFMWAYDRSCARYAAVRRSLGEPDPFRLRYRDRITETLKAVVQGKMDKTSATAFVQKQAAKNVPRQDASRFIGIVETELRGLHEGNIARYQLPPSQYQAWKNHWNSG